MGPRYLARSAAIVALLGSTALIAPKANAVLMISANINGGLLTCADGQACDTNAAPGQLSIANQTVNGVEIQGSNQIQQIGASNNLNTASFQIINHNLVAAQVQIAISGIDYVGPVSLFTATGAGTWQNAGGSNISMTYHADATNTQGANNPTDLPGTLLATLNDTAVGNADSFNQNFAGSFSAAGLYSMSLGTAGTLAAWDGGVNTEPTLVGRSQALITVQDVPEPASLAVLGMGLIGLGFIRRERRRG